MINKKLKCVDLPKLQKKIVLCLAEHGAMTMTDTNKKIKGGQQTSTNRAFNDLENKEMILKTDTKVWRGRSFNIYWLSMRGIAFALMNDTNPEVLKKWTLTYSKTDEDKKATEVYFVLHSLSPKIGNILDRFVLFGGKLEPTELFKQLLPEMVSMDKTELDRLFDNAKEFPDYWKYTEETLTNFIDALKALKGK